MAESNADARRQRVLEAAIMAIADVGVEKLRMTDIARRAGMTPGHILYYFERKDRILLETLRYSEQDLAARRRAELDRMRSPRRKLDRVIDLYLPTGRDDTRWNLWTQLLVRPAGDAETATVLEHLNDLWRDDLCQILGDRDTAERLCYLMDGLAWDMLAGSPSLTRARAVAIARGSVEAGRGARGVPRPARTSSS